MEKRILIRREMEKFEKEGKKIIFIRREKENLNKREKGEFE